MECQRVKLSEDFDVALKMIGLCWLTSLAFCNSYAKRMAVFSISTCGEIKLEPSVSWIGFVNHHVVINFTDNGD